MQEKQPDSVPTLNLTFNLDGSIDPALLVGLPQELVDRVTSPEFKKEAEARIRSHRMQTLAVHRFRERAAEVRAAADLQHQLRRPDGVSGRQRKRLKRAARKLARVNLNSNRGGLENAKPELSNHESGAVDGPGD